jgi:hypothetical protein
MRPVGMPALWRKSPVQPDGGVALTKREGSNTSGSCPGARARPAIRGVGLFGRYLGNSLGDRIPATGGTGCRVLGGGIAVGVPGKLRN